MDGRRASKLGDARHSTCLQTRNAREITGTRFVSGPDLSRAIKKPARSAFLGSVASRARSGTPTRPNPTPFRRQTLRSTFVPLAPPNLLASQSQKTYPNNMESSVRATRDQSFLSFSASYPRPRPRTRLRSLRFLRAPIAPIRPSSPWLFAVTADGSKPCLAIADFCSPATSLPRPEGNT